MHRPRFSALLLTGLLGIGLESTARAAGPTTSPPTLYTPEGAPKLKLELPAPALGSLVHGDRVYVALGASGLAIFDVSGGVATLASIRTFDADVIGVTLVDGRPWVMLRQHSARPLTDVPVTAGPGGVTTAPGPREGSPPLPSGAPLPAASSGQVAVAGPGFAILDRGLDQGLAAGDLVRILTRTEVPPVELGLEGDRPAYREEEAGVGEVVTIGPSRSRVILHRNGIARPGDRFERVAALSRASFLAPRRLGGMFEVTGTVRPFLALENIGVGSINDASVTWIDHRNLFAEARLQPLTAGGSRDGNVFGVTALALGGYDHRFFAVGLGLGFSNTGVTTQYEEDFGTGTITRYELPRTGLSIGQFARLGSRDGLHLEVRNMFVLGTVEVYESEYTYDPYTGEYVVGESTKINEYQEVRWNSSRGRLVVPVARVTDLFAEVGGGAELYFFHAEGGVQTWLRGSGGPGSLGISASAGYGLLGGRETRTLRNTDMAGPLVSVGIRKRF